MNPLEYKKMIYEAAVKFWIADNDSTYSEAIERAKQLAELIGIEEPKEPERCANSNCHCYHFFNSCHNKCGNGVDTYHSWNMAKHKECFCGCKC